jgi:hypothetical protein
LITAVSHSRGDRRAASPGGLRPLSLLLLAFFLASPAALQAQEVSREFQLKAAFLYNFTKFVEWPARSFSGPTSPIIIAVLGRNVFGAELEKAVVGRTVNGRNVVVKSIQTSDAARGAHLVFISTVEDGRLEEVKEICRGSGVLVVGETESFARRGGSITFKLEGDKLRFEINTAAAAQGGLKVSAQLQKLAASVLQK